MHWLENKSRLVCKGVGNNKVLTFSYEETCAFCYECHMIEGTICKVRSDLNVSKMKAFAFKATSLKRCRTLIFRTCSRCSLPVKIEPPISISISSLAPVTLELRAISTWHHHPPAHWSAAQPACLITCQQALSLDGSIDPDLLFCSIINLTGYGLSSALLPTAEHYSMWIEPENHYNMITFGIT